MSLIDAPLSLATFRAIFVKDGSWASFLGMLKDLTIRPWSKTGKRHVKEGLIMTFMALSVVFVMMFPTLAGAMTGYTATYAAYVKDHDGNYARFATFKPIVYNISDSHYSNFTSYDPGGSILFISTR